ncbi:hypothetical protein [Metabacillus iocasae]|uniref:ATP synthase F0 subunit 8 n=1 Tax=Priestia iocasae TaxID=2291674 RepID=A0ABS2QTY4_9BACI|nr:hypothetical protein [Metabacillus iocasae]MBM7702875.1 hypothetical protein [Metabacillus iocasae]
MITFQQLLPVLLFSFVLFVGVVIYLNSEKKGGSLYHRMFKKNHQHDKE